MKYPKPEWPDEGKGKYSRGYFQKYVIASLWERVAIHSASKEVKDPLQVGITELALESVFGGLDPWQIAQKLRGLQRTGRIQLAKSCHLWILGPRETERAR